MSSFSSLRGVLGAGGDTILVSELNFDASRVGHPAYRCQGTGDAGPSIASGAKRTSCARVCRPTRAPIDAARITSALPATKRRFRLDASGRERREVNMQAFVCGQATMIFSSAAITPPSSSLQVNAKTPLSSTLTEN